jgi:hypothetical protein
LILEAIPVADFDVEVKNIVRERWKMVCSVLLTAFHEMHSIRLEICTKLDT